MLRILIRILLLGLGILFLAPSGLVLLSGKQISKNRLLLADMQDRVAAVERFELKNNRPPTEEEFQSVLAGLPVRYSEKFVLASTERDCPLKVHGGWPNTPGWVMYFWRGDWFEYYTSWSKHYTLAEKASWWGFCGPMLFCPPAAALLIACSFLPVLRRKHAGIKPASPPVVHQPTAD